MVVEGAEMEVVADVVSSAGVGSVSGLPVASFMEPLAVFVVCAVNCSTRVTVADPLPAIEPRLQLMLPAADEQVPWLEVTEMKFAPLVGHVSLRLTEGMVVAVELLTLIV